MSKYIPTIGLEIHAELNTKTKMFCDCLNDREETRPNFNVCPVCLAHPGTLPTINEKAVELVVKLGLALGAHIPEFSKFDRKNYFYPDLPKGYQLSQYDEPLVKGGELAGVRLTRVHLEEDAGKLIHDEKGGTLVDYNRAGRALMELVSEPDIHSIDQALQFARELQLILKYLNVSDADMERGLMRFDANISISPDPKRLGTKVEVKNLNSFRALREAIAYELTRQEGCLESGGRIVQETVGWDDVKKRTYSQRSKEEAHDYRYMPEPDLPPLTFTPEELNLWKAELSELPSHRRERFTKLFKLTPAQVDALVEDKDLGEYYEETISELAEDVKTNASVRELAYNYLTSDLLGLVKASGQNIKKIVITPAKFADLLELIIKGELGSRGAKDILSEMFTTNKDAHEIMRDKNLVQISSETELGKIVAEIIAANPGPVNDYKKGKIVALEALIGRAMGKLKGRGNPEILRQLFLKELTNQ